MDLSKGQRNEIFIAITKGGLNPEGCKMNYQEHETGFTINDSPTGSYFAALVEKDQTYRYLLTIANDPADHSWHYIKSWGQLLDAVQDWSRHASSWQATPDLWALGRNWRSFVGPGRPEADNSPFTPDEQDFISDQLSAIRDSLRENYELTKTQAKEINERLEELKKDSKRLGRKDWNGIAIAGFFGLALTDIITPGMFQHILIMLAHGIGYLFPGPASGGVLDQGKG
jgi:hypothetical protein